MNSLFLHLASDGLAPLSLLVLQATAAGDPAALPSALSLGSLLSPERITVLIRTALVLGLGVPLVYGASRWLNALVAKRYNPQRGLVAGKLLLYPGVILVVVTTLSELGFSLAPLLGAAGIVGIALGFASQTSVSNIISGFFLIGEQPFVVDDVIQVGDTVGRVLSVDMLSVKLRTFDNRFVRIPNENMIKSQVINITRFPIRRADLLVGVAYKENVERVRLVLLEVARVNPLVLMEPEPTVFFDGFGDSAINLRFTVWATKENFVKLKNILQEEIKARFDAEGIEIPFPHRSLYAGSATDPFPVRIIAADVDGSEAPPMPPESAPGTKENTQS
ncbi:MAG: mechanosensitive ion channel family protein [Gemmatimonadota bacterium]